MKVICANRGKHDLCWAGCGATKPHDLDSCEPCPIDKKLHCGDVQTDENEATFLEEKISRRRRNGL
jgi:hypothetical protein